MSWPVADLLWLAIKQLEMTRAFLFLTYSHFHNLQKEKKRTITRHLRLKQLEGHFWSWSCSSPLLDTVRVG